MGDSQHLRGKRRRDGVDMTHFGLAIIVDRNFHRSFRDRSNVDSKGRRPCEPYEAGNNEPRNCGPQDSLRPVPMHSQSRVLRTATRSSWSMRSRTTRAENKAAVSTIPVANA